MIKNILLTLLLIFPAISYSADLSYLPSIAIGGITETSGSFNPFYQLDFNAELSKTDSKVGGSAKVSASTYQIPYYLSSSPTGNGIYNKQLVDEWKFDYSAASDYHFEYDDIFYKLYGGFSGLYIYNDIVAFNAVGPTAGFKSTSKNDWGNATGALDYTQYLYSKDSYSSKELSNSNYAVSAKSIYGKPVFASNYSLSFLFPYNDKVSLDYSFKGEVIKFDHSYRYYNGLSFGVFF